MGDKKLDIGLKVSKNTIIGNMFLSIIKIVIGVVAQSSAMMADGIHSFSDVISTIGVIIGLKLSHKAADTEHPYGHERIESLSSLFLSIMLFLVAIGIGYSGIENILKGTYSTPGALAIFAAIISIISKEWMYHYTMKYAKEINSASLKADAWHHRSDSLSSIGALIGIIGARAGYSFLDPLVALIICVLIIKVAFDILKQSIAQLIDESASPEKVNDITNKILSVDGVIHIDSLKTRQYASKLFVDVEIAVDATITVEAGHKIAQNVHNLIEEDETIKHCMVHVNPYHLDNHIKKIEKAVTGQ